MLDRVLESTDNMCPPPASSADDGIGLNLFVDAIARLSPNLINPSL